MAETPEERIRSETEANVLDYAQAIARRRRERAPEPVSAAPRIKAWWWGRGLLAGTAVWMALSWAAGWLIGAW